MPASTAEIAEALQLLRDILKKLDMPIKVENEPTGSTETL